LNRTLKIRKTFGKGDYDYLKEFNYHHWQTAFLDVRGTPPAFEDIKSSLMAKTPSNPLLEKSPPHVVLLVMESFGSYWNDKDGPDFNLLGELKNHFNQGILFKNFLPAENGTIGSIVSVATSQVIRPGSRFLNESEFMNTRLASAGHLAFKAGGYETHFVYGGKIGWRDLGKYLTIQGYDKLWGADEIKESMPDLQKISARELGNEWGVFDEYLYSFIEERLKNATKPQFILILTTSNHPPFEYPPSYKTLPLNLTLEQIDKLTLREDLAIKRFLGFQYANQKAGEFLTRVKASQVNSKTIVALTGDHSFWVAKGVGSEQEFRRYSVPFFLSVPEAYRPKAIDLEKFGSHEDIFPTLYHLALSNRSYVKLGENLFGEDNTIAINSSGIVASKDGAFHNGHFWKWKDRTQQILEPAEETPELLKLKKYREGLIGITDQYLKQEKTHARSSETATSL
jgi:phosphoglycerol transferase MdoB-like AlkP superfamily enzyme